MKNFECNILRRIGNQNQISEAPFTQELLPYRYAHYIVVGDENGIESGKYQSSEEYLLNISLLINKNNYIFNISINI